MPKEKTINLDELQFPKYVFTETITKKIKTKTSDSAQLASVPKYVVQLKAKNFMVFLADVPNSSSLNLYFDELQSVKGLLCIRLLPERPIFKYNSGVNRTWPLNRILEDDYKVLVKIYTKFQKKLGFTQVVKSEILNKITKIRKS